MESEVLNEVRTERQRLTKKRDTLVAAFTKAAGTGKSKRLSELFIKICQTNEFLRSLDQIDSKQTGVV